MARKNADLLAAGISRLLERGPAHPFSRFSWQQLAEQAHMSETSVRRIAGPAGAFRDRAAAVVASRNPWLRGTFDLWASMRCQRVPVTDTRPVFERALSMHHDDSLILPRAATWANLRIPEVREQVAHANLVFRDVLRLETVVVWREDGRRPHPDLDLDGACAAMMMAGVGALIVVLAGPVGDAGLLGWATTLEGCLAEAVSVAGAIGPDVHPTVRDPAIAAPFVPDAQAPLIEALLALAATHGPAAPLDHLTVRDVTSVARCAPSALYRYWGSIDEYRLEVLATLLGRVEMDLRRGPTTPGPQTTRARVARLARGPTTGALMMSCVASRDPDYRALSARHLGAIAEMLAHDDPCRGRDLLSFALGRRVLGAMSAELVMTGPERPRDVLPLLIDRRLSPDWPSELGRDRAPGPRH